MKFIWPVMLLGFAVVPLVVALYLDINRRRRLRAASFGASLPGVAKQAGLRRHIPPILFLSSLVIILAALARPEAVIRLPRVEGTVMLVFDVSGSMAADDVKPTRLEAAKAAARDFILSQPSTVDIGIVAFSSSGFTVQSPTNDPNTLLAAINRLEPTTGTSLGQGILAALSSLAVNAGLKTADQAQAPNAPQAPANPQQPAPFERDLLAQLPAGPYPSSVIVLLSDGENNEAIDPVQAAQVAAQHDVRIDALGFGTPAGVNLKVNGISVHTALDENTLRQITQAANGTYFTAEGQQDPKAVYASLAPHLVVKSQTMEVTAIFAGASLLILLLGSLFSMVWFGRLI